MLDALRLVVGALAALALAAVIGLSATWWTVANGLPVSGLRIGPWKAEPDAGGLRADPYELAATARSGEAPLAYGDGLGFTAATDDEGRTLNASCDYELSGELPAARLWTLAPFSPTGQRFSNGGRDVSLTSASALRIADAPLRIVLSRRAHPGNWAPLERDGAFVLRLTLYDTTIGTSLETSSPLRLLSLTRRACS